MPELSERKIHQIEPGTCLNPDAYWILGVSEPLAHYSLNKFTELAEEETKASK